MARYGWGWERRPKKKIEAGTGIRAGRKFGTTWWGEQWLEAFNYISDSNRLPRGRTYARNGSVRTIDIKDNRVKATVLGSRTYSIDIEIPKFTKAETKKITELVAERPDLLSALLNRELPPELNAACKEAGVHIFPRRWDDLKAQCSCPDWAMPCKHLAAIIYLIGNEIDKNPFMVFDLHGFDLVAALKKAGYASMGGQAASLLTYDSLWEKKKRKSKKKTKKTSWDAQKAANLDFGEISEMREQLTTILSEQPVFYPDGDFRKMLRLVWGRIAKFGTRIAKDKDQLPDSENETVSPIAANRSKQSKAKTEEQADFTPQFEKTDRIRIILNELGKIDRIRIQDEDKKLLFETRKMGIFLSWLSKVPPGRLGHFSDDIAALWYCQLFAEVCVRNSAIVPQALDFGTQGLGVRWLPALLQPTVRALYDALHEMLPPKLLRMEHEGEKWRPTSDDYFLHLLSFFIQYYVENGSAIKWSEKKNEITSIFFEGGKAVFDKFENREYPQSIDLWLNRFFMGEKATVPVLEVQEVEENVLAVSLLVEDKKSKKNEAPIPFEQILKLKKYADSRLHILRDLATLGQYFEGIKTLVAQKGEAPLYYETKDFAEVLFEKMPVIRLFGIKIILPKALDKILRPRISLKMSAPSGAVLSGSTLSLKRMLSYQWQVALGDKQVSQEEFMRMVQSYNGLFKLRDEYVYFDEKEVEKLAARLAKPPTLSGGDLLQVALSEEYDGAPIVLDKAARKLMKQLLSTDQIPVPSGLQATLRPYQHRGFSWMIKNAKLGFGSILADDMGLGKTIQVITTLLHFQDEGLLHAEHPALAVLPTTLITNWEKEIEKFAPTLSTLIYHGSKRDPNALQTADIVLTSYGVARSDAAKLSKMNWSLLVIDESQNIKNPNTAQTKAVKKIKAPIRIAMSGTPVENRLSEYWSVFDFVNKGLLNSLPAFKREFAIPIEGERNQRVLKRFHRITEPFVLRRLKTDKSIISDLPDKIEQNQFCQLTKEQAALYEKTVQKVMKKIDSSEGIERKGLVLTLIMSLKQICNHPTQFLKKGKADASLSGKCPLLLDLLRQALQNDEKTLIFTQFRAMGELIATMLQEELGFETPFLHGGVSRKKRDKMVEDFQEKRSEKVFILSLKAGGTGLNLTAASQVIHFDLWWNPAVEAQATDRAFRIGQKRNVQVHRFITEATFEERINEMLQKKKELANLTVKSGENWIGELSNKELREVFALG